MNRDLSGRKALMYCSRCLLNGHRRKMKPSKRSFHKKTKWICKRCGLIRMKKSG